MELKPKFCDEVYFEVGSRACVDFVASTLGVCEDCK